MEIENVYKQVGYLKTEESSHANITATARPPFKGKHKKGKATNRSKPKKRK